MEVIEGEQLQRYANGAITDVQLIRNVLKERLGALKDGDESTFVIGDHNFGSDSAGFIASLKGSADEIDALRYYLAQYKDSIVIQTDRASEALSSIWEASYREILECFTSSETADAIGDVSKKNLQSVLRDARMMERSKDVVKALPVFRHHQASGCLCQGDEGRWDRSPVRGTYQQPSEELPRTRTRKRIRVGVHGQSRFGEEYGRGEGSGGIPRTFHQGTHGFDR